ncbi:uncharacterized protein BDW70DRAFT_46677 [Aspergillus foveolatus]|uniref:uncharacterized protein n=1 Tax=Aspergillus foveolatus TaxID=210207 RepID=UPI003CCE091A
MHGLIQSSTMSLPDLLQNATDFIILHKDHLPDGAHDQLLRTFSQARLSPRNIRNPKALKTPKKTQKPKNPKQSTKPKSQEFQERINRAREFISQKRQIDVIPSPDLVALIKDLDAFPLKFWNVIQMGSSWDGNLMRHLYQRNRQSNTMSVIYRAFTTTATFLLVKRTMREFEVTNFTPRVECHCCTLIMNDTTDVVARRQVEQNLKDDFRVGKLWHRYAAHLGGYGAFFLMGVATTSWYEDLMKAQDDVDFIASHFKTIKIPELASQLGLHHLGLRMLNSILPGAEHPALERAENPVLPEQTQKRKFSKNNFTDSGSAPPQTGDAPSSMTSSGCVQSNRSSALPMQGSSTQHGTDRPSPKRARYNQTATFEGRDDECQWVVEAPRQSSLAASPRDSMLSHGLTSNVPGQIGGYQKAPTETQNSMNYRPSTTQKLPEQQPGRQAAGQINRQQRSTHQNQGSHSIEPTLEQAVPKQQLEKGSFSLSAHQTIAPSALGNVPQGPRPILHTEENRNQRSTDQAHDSHSTEPTPKPVQDPASSARETSTTFGGHQKELQMEGITHKTHRPIFPTSRSIAEASMQDEVQIPSSPAMLDLSQQDSSTRFSATPISDLPLAPSPSRGNRERTDATHVLSSASGPMHDTHLAPLVQGTGTGDNSSSLQNIQTNQLFSLDSSQASLPSGNGISPGMSGYDAERSIQLLHDNSVYDGTSAGILPNGYDPQQGLYPLYDGVADISVDGYNSQLQTDITNLLFRGYDPQNDLRPIYDGTSAGTLPNGYDPQQGLYPLYDGSAEISVDGYNSEQSRETVHGTQYMRPNGYDPQHRLRQVLPDDYSSMLHTSTIETNMPALASKQKGSTQTTSRPQSHLQAGDQARVVGFFGGYHCRSNTYGYGQAEIQSLPIMTISNR